MIIILMISSTVIRPIYTTNIIVAIIHYGNEVNIKKNEINIERNEKVAAVAKARCNNHRNPENIYNKNHNLTVYIS